MMHVAQPAWSEGWPLAVPVMYAPSPGWLANSSVVLNLSPRSVLPPQAASSVASAASFLDGPAALR